MEPKPHANFTLHTILSSQKFRFTQFIFIKEIETETKKQEKSQAAPQCEIEMIRNYMCLCAELEKIRS